MRTILLALIAVVTLVAAPSVAMAGGGGGGTKPTAIVKIKNNSGGQIVAVLAPAGNSLSNIQSLFSGSAPVTIAQVEAAAKADGALLIKVSANNSKQFPAVQAGGQQLIVADITGGNVGNNLIGSANVTAVKNKTVTKTVAANGAIN